MADFYPILSRAVAGLADNSPDTRRAIYDRARTALVAQLRGLDPPLGEAEIMRERLALDEAVSRIEAQYEAAPGREAIEPAPLPERVTAGEARPALGPAPARPEPQAPAAVEERYEEPEPASDPQDYAAQAPRPRVTPPREKRVKPVHVRAAVVGVGIAIAVAAIAATAYYVNKINPQDAARTSTTPQAAAPPQQDSAGKINERVGAPPANQQASSEPVDVTVAQRALFYTEVPDNPQQPIAVQGRVVWRLDSESAGQGRPVETIVRATVEVPEAQLTLDFTVRRNTDSAFPASHIIGLRFTTGGDPAQTSIREIGVPQFKTAENERGAPLSAINSALGDNLFVAALSNVPIEVERNRDLLLNRNWIDIPVRLASGRRGIVTFEKGAPGSRTLSDAFNRW